MIDLRSDTVTKPSKEMKLYALDKEVGDDVYGEDPTVNELQNMAIDITGKQRAIYVVSGSMGNQLAIKTHTQPGDEVILEYYSHPFNHEAGGAGTISGITFHPILGKNGIMDPQNVEKVIRDKARYYSPTSLIIIENTHNWGGGTVYPLEIIKEIHTIAKKNNIKMHLDGARIFNASIASGISVKEYASYFDTISFCLSKGLGAPIGSIFCGSNDSIEYALRIRTMMGGGWRQAGVIAAMGIYALKNNIQRLEQDHQNAKKLSGFINESKQFDLINKVETNIVLFSLKSKDVTKTKKFINYMKEKEILISSIDSRITLRVVTHIGITDNDVNIVGNAIKKFNN